MTPEGRAIVAMAALLVVGLVVETWFLDPWPWQTVLCIVVVASMIAVWATRD